MKKLYFPPRIAYLLIAALLFSISILPAKAQQKRITGAKAATLQNNLNTLRATYNVKGISAAVYSPKLGTWKGVTGISHGTVALDTTMLLSAGSVTKTFIA